MNKTSPSPSIYPVCPLNLMGEREAKMLRDETKLGSTKGGGWNTFLIQSLEMT